MAGIRLKTLTAVAVTLGVLASSPAQARTIHSHRNAPESSPAHAGLATPVQVGRPHLDAYSSHFRSAAKTHKIDESWLRAVAHVESAFQANQANAKKRPLSGASCHIGLRLGLRRRVSSWTQNSWKSLRRILALRPSG